MYGIAVDDAHNYHTFGPNNANPGRGWVMVRSPNLSADAIIKNMEAGNFYSSTGVELDEIKMDQNQMYIKIK